MKAQWEESRREAARLLAAADEENYRTRLEYHEGCNTENPAELARTDASVLHILTLEEYDERLLVIWNDINRRLRGVMEELEGRAGGNRSKRVRLLKEPIRTIE